MSSLPVIKYTEETESPLVGDGIEGTQSPSGVQNVVLVDSSFGRTDLQTKPQVCGCPALLLTGCVFLAEFFLPFSVLQLSPYKMGIIIVCDCRVVVQIKL